MSDKVRVAKLYLPTIGGERHYVCPVHIDVECNALYEEVRVLCDEGAIGDELKIVIDEMTQGELDSLPEFEGW